MRGESLPERPWLWLGKARAAFGFAEYFSRFFLAKKNIPSYQVVIEPIVLLFEDAMTNKDCIFCKLIRGELPCSKVLETETILAFLDIAPINKGHALVIPKGHYQDIWAVPSDMAAHMQEAIQKVGRGLVAALGAQGLNVGMNNGTAAGQLVFHAHWHLIPRFTGDGLAIWPPKKYDSVLSVPW